MSDPLGLKEPMTKGSWTMLIGGIVLGWIGGCSWLMIILWQVQP